MDRRGKREKKTLIKELTQGKELANQLRNHLNPCASSPETRQFLIQKILCSYEKAISILGSRGVVSRVNGEPDNKVNFTLTVDSPSSFSNGSLRSENSNLPEFKDHKDVVYKKRKTVQRWTEQVKVYSGKGLLEGPLDDGYCWRKYGQKDIHKANFPRGYYRCTHRHTQGCLATKQVQRSNDDPTIFEVTYRGRHTCIPTTTSGKEDSKEILNQIHQQRQQVSDEITKPKESREIMFDFSIEHKVKTEDSNTKDDIFPSFGFSQFGNDGYDVFMNDPSMMENSFMMSELFSLPSTYISPATSESNYLVSSPTLHMSNFGGGYDLQTSESDLVDQIISNTTSVTNSPVGDFDFSIDNIEFFK